MNIPFGRNIMPQNLPHSFRMVQNGNNGAFLINVIREFPLPDSLHSPLMGQNLNNGALPNLWKWNRYNGARRKIMGQKSRIPSFPECHILGNVVATMDNNVTENGAIFQLAPFCK